MHDDLVLEKNNNNVTASLHFQTIVLRTSREVIHVRFVFNFQNRFLPVLLILIWLIDHRMN